MPYKDDEKRQAASKRYYAANKQYYLERNRRYRKEIADYVNTIKTETPCADCKKNYPYYVMDFDHLDASTKKGLVSKLKNTRSINALVAEIPKCEVVCANCHRERTHNRLQKNKKQIR